MTGDKPSFIAFDIDGTLVRWQFFHAIVHELGKRGYIDTKTHESIRNARMQWKQRVHDEAFRAYEDVLVRGYLGALEQLTEHDHEEVIDSVFEEYKDQLFTYPRDLLQRCRKEGKLVFAISGSHELILRKLADHVGIDDFVGARLQFTNGKYTGIGSTPIHDKAAALQTLAEKHGASFKDSIAIGDSESDIAMLNIVERPIAFNPSKGLFNEAEKRGWRVVIERKNVIYELEARDGSYVLAQTNQ